MIQHWMLAILFIVQAVLPIGGGACLCATMVAPPVDDCRCGCDPAAGDERCCYEAGKQPANHTNATLTKVQESGPHLCVLSKALPRPTIAADTAVIIERTITPCDLSTCLTRAERAPPA
jgi:hypothetical protein